MSLPTPRQEQRGVYFVVVALMLSVILGFGALAVDVSYIRLAEAQTQDVADAAGQAALAVLRRTGDEDEAELAAEAVVAANEIAGEPGVLSGFVTGDWDYDNDALDEGADTPNAVQVTVERSDTNALQLLLAPVLGVDNVDVAASSTSAARDLDAVIVFDLTNSWSRPNFYEARDAAVGFYDVITNSYGPEDRLGMVVFSSIYAYEFTEFTKVEDAASDGSVLAQWESMETYSKAGTPTNNSKGCSVSSTRDDYTNPFVGGCFPDMPREYADESGTDHSIGMEAAIEMFNNIDDNGAYRAVLVLTDGQPNGTRGDAGDDRAAVGYAETRWPEYVGTGGKSAADVRIDSVATAEEMYADLEINTWTISFNSDGAFLDDMAQGDGYYTLTNDATELEEIFVDIANSLPLAIVE